MNAGELAQHAGATMSPEESDACRREAAVTIALFPLYVDMHRAGKSVFGFLIGHTLKRTQGKLNLHGIMMVDNERPESE